MKRARLAVLALIVASVWSIPASVLAQEIEIPEMTTPPTTVPASAASGGEVSALATCSGCVAAYGLWDGALNIRALRESRTDETVTRIHVHGSILKAFNDSCNGDWRFGDSVDDFTLTGNNTSSWQTHDETYWQGSQHSWGNVGAHEWEDEGATWKVGENGETDLCKTF